jgi:hypothetical protein
MTRKGGKRKYRGGNYSSATGYNDYVNGASGNDQYNRVFSASSPYNTGNGLVGAQGQQVFHQPNTGNSSLLNGGRRRRHRTRRGGNLGTILSQAVVPFSLLGLQQSYRKKRGGTRKRRH